MLIPTRSFSGNRLLPVLALAIVVPATLAGCNGSGNGSHDDTNDTPLVNDNEGNTPDNHQQASVSYSTVADGVWPPQPVGIDNVQPYTGNTIVESDGEPKSTDTATAALSVIMQEPGILSLLGNRYEVIGQYSSGDKYKQSSARAIEIFSYSHNQVVRVSVDDDNRIHTSLQSASEYQPAETENEIQRAVTLAADQLLLQGYPTNHLTGSGLLAHPTTAEFSRDHKAFYEHRIIYVTFGRGEGSTPLFRADVDLSTETVSNAGPL